MKQPAATYRLQLDPRFRFDDAGRAVRYLRALGISHVYSSPILAARSGSTHGYDVVDPTRINSELGGRAAFDAFSNALRAEGLGLILDIVPNHMAASPENAWWTDVLENGRASRYAEFFDIEWHVHGDAVLLPVLGKPYGDALESGDIRLQLGDLGFEVKSGETRYPIDPGTYGRILCAALPESDALIATAQSLPPRNRTGVAERGERERRARQLKERLRDEYTTRAGFRARLDAAIASINGRPGDAASFDTLDAILAEQPYRLSFWRTAGRELNYRRFFDITDLVGLRQENDGVFDATHALIFELIDEGRVDGLRIDHIDGLWDPAGYLERLRASLPRPVHIVVEKIFARDERLSETWPVEGTTGYEFARLVNGFFTDSRGLQMLQRFGDAWTGDRRPFAEVLYEQKRRVLGELFTRQVAAVAARLYDLAQLDRHGRDISVDQLSEALLHVTAHLPVYRTYLRPGELPLGDVEVLRDTIDFALRTAPKRDARAISFIGRALTSERPDCLNVAMRWQQLTGPVTAKGLEDTALYAYNRLISCNEVGSRPDECAEPTASLVSVLAARPNGSLNATSTHDTKRSEDVRARISALSEAPSQWVEAVERWRLSHGAGPDPSSELAVYQTIAGVLPWEGRIPPSLIRRVQDASIKAAREAKTHTSWLDIDRSYERSLRAFVARLLRNESFVVEMREVITRMRESAVAASLGAVVLKIAAPGVADIYWGNETWNYSLVDPDNRRRVDFGSLESTLNSLPRDASEVSIDDAKLYITARALDARARHAELFSRGEVIAIDVRGPGSRRVCAFARRLASNWAVAVVTRPTGTFRPSIVLPDGAPERWCDVLSDRTHVSTRRRSLALANVLWRFPVALLTPLG